jgi:hypothetical protein
MKIIIKMKNEAQNKSYEFNSATKAMKLLNGIKCNSFTLNNEPCNFQIICELYQLELAEKRHNKAQGF